MKTSGLLVAALATLVIGALPQPASADSIPGLRGHEKKIEQMLARDVDAAALFRRTRLAGAPEPVIASDTRAINSGI